MGRVALVTGAARGLGADMAVALAARGASVAVNYRGSAAEAGEVVARIEALGGRAVALQAGVCRTSEVRSLIGRVAERLGGLHILINNVGDYLKAPVLEITPEQWRQIFESNLHSAFDCIHAALPLLREGRWGRIINLGFASAGRVSAEPMITAYHIAKTGLLTLTRSLAVALAPEGVTVNMVSPGVLESSRSKPLSDIPAGRLGRHDELIAWVLFLMSPAGDYVTGNHLEVSGGWRL